jgi:glycine/D-amino acid oxidase-like deaminating enzyme
MPSKSFWLEESKEQQYETLVGEASADVIIVGGGIAGLTSAYYLTKAGKKVVVVEAKSIGRGATGHTTAHITSQHDLIYAKLTNKFGWDVAKAYAKGNEAAILQIAENVSHEKIDCDFSFTDSYLFTIEEDKVTKIEEEAKIALKLGIKADIRRKDGFILPYLAAVRFKNQAIFHPVKYINGLAKAIVDGGGSIYEESRVLHIDKERVETEKGTVRAPIIVIATHFPVINLPGLYFARIYQHRSYIIALSGAPLVEGMWVSAEDKGKTFRNYHDLLVICGADHKTGTQSDVNHYENLVSFQKKYFPQSLLEYSWSAQDGITMDGLPYIGQYSKKTPGVYVATGFGKWGMTKGTMAGSIISDLITGKQNPYAFAFSPQRKFTWAALGGALSINATTTAHLVGGLFRVSCPTCPHFKCKLKWNKDESSWDCPCHGSRFDQFGHVLESPAIHGIVNTDSLNIK